MLRKLILSALFSSIVFLAFGRQGLWPPFLAKQFIGEMKEWGFQLDVADIYHPDSSSINDAIVHFGGGCTGGIISPKGLIVTNFHCSHRQVQSISSLENNYLENGFWASGLSDEIPIPGLTVSITVRMDDVTDLVLAGTDTISDRWERSAQMRKNIASIEGKAIIAPHQKASVRGFYQNNRYYMIVSETYSDIRLVGVPPESLGRFGGDTDNWMWPRHTADFSIFRIYANSNNEPSPYSSENVPYKPKRFLPVSIRGVNEGDFTMVYGYPGTTQSYIYSAGIDLLMNHSYPLRVAIRDIKINHINKAMKSDSIAAFFYSANLASISNAWKKWQGEILGLKRSDAISQKKSQEAGFAQWLTAKEERTKQYGWLFDHFDSLYPQFLPYHLAFDLFTEAVFRGQDSYRVYLELNRLKNAKEQQTMQIENNIHNLYRNHTIEVERPSFVDMLSYYLVNMPERFGIRAITDTFLKGNVRVGLDRMFQSSVLTQYSRLEKLKWIVDENTLNPAIERDELFRFYQALQKHFDENINGNYYKLKEEIDHVQSLYMKALMEMQGVETLYPDANSTLRVSFGQVEGYRPADGVVYRYYTTLAGKMEKVSPMVDDYHVPKDFEELYRSGEYGQYADKGEPLVTCFIASNHTTGGNSGSPVLDAYGNLIGLNFDRCWEGTMSDLWYNPEICRNIALDMRYMLFLIDRYGGAGYLIDEMKIVE